MCVSVCVQVCARARMCICLCVSANKYAFGACVHCMHVCIHVHVYMCTNARACFRALQMALSGSQIKICTGSMFLLH